MISSALVGSSIAAVAVVSANCRISPFASARLNPRAFLRQPSTSSPSSVSNEGVKKSSVLLNSLRSLEWDKLCDAVASFAGTPFGREATKAQLGSLNQTFEESRRLLDETNAAVEIFKYGGGGLDFSTIDVVLVKSAVEHVRKGLPLDGNEAMAIVALLQFARALQCNLEAAMNEDADSFKRFMPLSEVVMEMVINQSVIRSIQQFIDEDGSVKDSACPTVKNGRRQVQMLEKKIHQLMGKLIRDEASGTSALEMSSIDGRLCIKFDNDQPTSLKGLLLSSHSGVGCLIEPLFVVSLNDELQQARALVAKAETDVLINLSEKIKGDVYEIEKLLYNIIELDAINARAIFSVSLGGTFPDLTSSDKGNTYSTAEALGDKNSKALYPRKGELKLCLPKAYHPLLLWQHHMSLQNARKDFKNATAEVRRRKLQGESLPPIEETNLDLSYLEMQISKLEQSRPVPLDFFISHQTTVLVISGPNAGGKTICLKTVGMAAMMAKSGLYVLASEPVRIPWFDSVFADIGDEQSLLLSLSTFSGHLKQLNDIRSQSTSQSLVLLDEVGAGTNPLEGTALGMSLLEYFAKEALLTVSATHLGELKALKYSYEAFENACMEFDEVNVKPTYKILLGIPGRSNAISIAERLGLPRKVLDNARELYGSASTNINAVIIDMERLKQDFLEHYHEAQRNLKLAGDLYETLLVAERNIIDHGIDQRYKKMQTISDLAAKARSVLRRKVRELGAFGTQSSMPSSADNYPKLSAVNSQHTAVTAGERLTSNKSGSSNDTIKREQPSGKRTELPKVGDVVLLPSLRKKASVLKVDLSKEEIVVQAGNMKLKLKLSDVAV